MTREERAAYIRVYMREYRDGKRRRVPREKPAPKRPPHLDRSKPTMENVKLDRPGYMRQYMRWVRAGKPQ